MKSSINVSAPKFQPIEVKITLESQEDLDRFTSLIGNWQRPGKDACDLYKKLTEAGGVCTIPD